MNPNVLDKTKQTILCLNTELHALDTELLGDGRAQSVFQTIDQKTWCTLYYRHCAKIARCMDSLQAQGVCLCDALNHANATANEEEIRRLDPVFRFFLELEAVMESFSQAMDRFTLTESDTLSIALIRQELRKLANTLNQFNTLGKDG